MTRIDIIIPEELNTKFRNAVNKKLGMKKGNLTKAFEEAMQDWIKK